MKNLTPVCKNCGRRHKVTTPPSCILHRDPCKGLLRIDELQAEVRRLQNLSTECAGA